MGMANPYIDRFFGLRAARDLLPFFIGSKKGSAKEITESFACYAAADYVGCDLQNSVVICPGDGASPRTAATFAFLTLSECHSIDPILNLDKYKEIEEYLGFKVRRLNIYKSNVEDVKIDCGGKKCIVVACHSHAKMEDMINCATNYEQMTFIALPCCNPINEKYFKKEFAKKTEYISYVDGHIWSPKRTFHIWKKMR